MTTDSPFFSRPVREIDDIEQPAVAYAERRGWFQCKFVSPGLKGVPDRFFARQGVILLVEFKAPGKQPSSQQKKRHKELRDHGVEVHWIDNLEAAYALFR